MTKILDHGHVELVDSMPTLLRYAGTGTEPEWGHNDQRIVDAGTDTVPMNPEWGHGDQRIVDAARVSIAGGAVRPTSDNEKLLRYLLTNQHTTPFETVRFTFDVKLPIFVARQWIRYRTGSFNEMSARYGVLPEEFYVPELGRMQAQASSNKQGSGDVLPSDTANEARAMIEASSREAFRDYRSLLAHGLARELARMVLPINIYTRWMWTTDLHNLMHFLQQRLHSHAQYEIRVYAEAIVDLIRPLVPCTIKIFEDTYKLGGKS